MRVFTCDCCGHLVFFESVECVHCGATLAFVPELMHMAAVQPHPGEPGNWQTLQAHTGLPALRMCRNRYQYSACNFTTDTYQPFCVSCRQTRWLPDLSEPGNLQRWTTIEGAKRQLFYSLSKLQLTVLQGVTAPSFEFLQDLPGQIVMTGHAGGTITINVAEADDDERARRRLELNEPYRTLLGHLRHESGHFFWDVLVRDSAWLEPFRQLFGDERQDYAYALQNHYARGSLAPQDWQNHFVSAYAMAHPWEDWAETWAHYLHIMDLVETAASYQVQLRLPNFDQSQCRMSDPFTYSAADFDRILGQCVPLTLMLNSLNRSLGQQDAYPFALYAGSVAKLKFVHELVIAHRSERQPRAA